MAVTTTLQWGRRNRKEGQSLDYHNVTGNVPFPLWFPSAAPAAPVHMRADKNVLSLTVTRCTFVHKHVQMEKAAAQPNYIIHDHVCGVSPFKRYVLSDEEAFFFFLFFFLNESLCTPEILSTRPHSRCKNTGLFPVTISCDDFNSKF